MKSITILLLFITVNTFAQKQFRWPKPIKDSTWIEEKRDTLHGIIEYAVGNGKVVGEGIVVTTEYTHWSEPIYSAKDQQRIDSFQNEKIRRNELFFSTGASGYGGTDENRTHAFIKNANGYKWVREPFTFTPSKHWSDSYVFGLLNKILRLIPSK